MIYCCENCHFTFERRNVCEQCPDCGKYCIHEATEQEKEAYLAYRQEERGA